MSEVCESLIDDYVSGSLTIDDLEQGLASVFDAMPDCHLQAQSYLQGLYTSDNINSEGFTEISQLISKVNIQSTLKNSQETDISYFSEDMTMHLTDMTGGDDDEDAGDKTVIVRASKTAEEVEKSEISVDRSEEISPISPQVVGTTFPRSWRWTRPVA